jgi:hypothetical protein
MRRELHEIEYFNWCFGQPYNMVLLVQVRGDLTPERLRPALDKAQERHPLLGVNIEIGARGIPWFSSERVGPIPLSVIASREPGDAREVVEEELGAIFAMDTPGSPRLPLMRVSMLLPTAPDQPVDLVFTVQHVIADGLSMLFLLRDLLFFMENPGAPVAVLDAPASPDDILPARVRRRIPTTPVPFWVTYWLARTYVKLRFGGAPAPVKGRAQHHRSWDLTPEQTSRLRARCRREGVSVQSAICAAFLPAFPTVHTPVSLRSLLGRPVGESFGLYVGAAQVTMRYDERRGLWDNARRFHRRLRRAMRDPFGILRLFSKAISIDDFRRLGPLLVAMTARERPFAITNLGDLDRHGVALQGASLGIESFSGAVTPILDSSALMVYTIDGRMRLHFLANEPDPSLTTIRDAGERAVNRLLAAIDARSRDPGTARSGEGAFTR